MQYPDGQLPAGVELRGTKCIGILGTGPHAIRAQLELQTRDPAAFGPLNLQRRSANFGWAARPVKPGWSDTELLGRGARRFCGPDVAAVTCGRDCAGKDGKRRQ